MNCAPTRLMASRWRRVSVPEAAAYYRHRPYSVGAQHAVPASSCAAHEDVRCVQNINISLKSFKMPFETYCCKNCK
jgi:hypothetical protein